MNTDDLMKLLTTVYDLFKNSKCYIYIPILIYVYDEKKSQDGKSLNVDLIPDGSFGIFGIKGSTPCHVTPVEDNDNISELMGKYSLTHYVSNIICEDITFEPHQNLARSEIRIELRKSYDGNTNITADMIEAICKLNGLSLK